ncbi:hypothetical protein NFJ02_15g20770 [Pycnococcus provasolii]
MNNLNLTAQELAVVQALRAGRGGDGGGFGGAFFGGLGDGGLGGGGLGGNDGGGGLGGLGFASLPFPMTLTSLRFENIWAILKRAIEENHDVATVDARRYAATTTSHKHHERVVIAGKGVEALKLHVSQAARERNARRRLTSIIHER